MAHITEANVLRYHYAQLANARNIASAARAISVESARRASMSSSSSGSSSSSTSSSAVALSVSAVPTAVASAQGLAQGIGGSGGYGGAAEGGAEIDPVLLALDLEREVEELGRLARAVIGQPPAGPSAVEELVAPSEGGNKGKAKAAKGTKGTKKRRNSETEVDSALALGEDPSPAKPKSKAKKKSASRPSHTSPTAPSTSAPIPAIAVVPMAIPTAHLLKSHPNGGAKARTSLPSHLASLSTGGAAPHTPRSSFPGGQGVEYDELSTPFQPTLFGRAQASGAGGAGGQGGTPARLGMTGGRPGTGLGSGKGRGGVGWAVSTPQVPRGVGSG